MAENAQQIIYDSLGWVEPTRAVAATFSWLQQFEQGLRGGRWRVASDLNWRRLKYWRRVINQEFDDAVAPGAVTSATELLVEHGPHAVVQAWELVSWLTSQLGWQVQAGKVQQGLEIAWQFQAPHGFVRVRIRRLPVGASEVLLLRMQCQLAGAPGAVVIRPEAHLGVFPLRSDALDGLLDPARRATVHHDRRPLLGEKRRDGETNSRRRAGDQCLLVRQLQIHRRLPFW